MRDHESLSNSTQSVASLEERKFSQETALRMREIELKEREIAIKEFESKRSRLLSPTVIGLFAAAIALFGNLVVALLNNRNTQAVERLREQSSLIIQAVSTGNAQAACNNLVSFINLGLLDDAEGRLARCKTAPESIPVLPGATHTYNAIDDTGWEAQMTSTVKRAELNDRYRYQVTFTIPQPPSSPYPFELVSIYAYHLSGDGQRHDYFELPSLNGSWKPGERITISADLPKSYIDDPEYHPYLRYCVGSKQGCLPSGNLLLSR